MKKKIFLYLLLSLALLTVFIKVFFPLFLYIVISLALTVILRPFVEYIYQLHTYHQKVMRFAAVVIAFMALALFILLFVVLLIPVIAEQLNVLANINYEELFLRLKIPISAVEQFLIKNILTDQKEGFLLHYIKDSITSFLIKTNFKKIVNYSVAFTGNILLGILAVVFITFILLYDNKSLRTF